MSRQRSNNISKSEEEKLVALVLEKKNVFENKRTNAVTSKQKNAAWEILAHKFNASSEASTIRTAKVLKEKYTNIKRMLRKTKVNERKELFMTGGGPPPKNKENCDPMLNQLNEVMGVSVNGLPARHDDDQIMSSGEEMNFFEALIGASDEEDSSLTGGVSGEIKDGRDELDKNFESSSLKEKSPLNWSNYHPTMLGTKKNRALKIQKQSKCEGQTTADIAALKKKVLEQHLEHARLEHEQRMMHAAEEHKIRMKILEMELKSKEV